MRTLLFIPYLLVFALTLQVTHIHIDGVELETTQCVMCVQHADDDALVTSYAVENTFIQPHTVTTENQFTAHFFTTRQRARSPPTHL